MPWIIKYFGKSLGITVFEAVILSGYFLNTNTFIVISDNSKKLGIFFNFSIFCLIYIVR